MPYKEAELKKVYWPIAEVLDILKDYLAKHGVHDPMYTSALRFYENEFYPFLAPKKNRTGERRYTKVDIQRLKDILKLLKIEGYTLWGAKRQLGLVKNGSSS